MHTLLDAVLWTRRLADLRLGHVHLDEPILVYGVRRRPSWTRGRRTCVLPQDLLPFTPTCIWM